MQTVKKKLSELHKTQKNIRKHSDKQIDEYIRSLTMFGQIRPLVVTEDGEILVGNGMYDALTKMGKEDCDCYVVEGLSKTQRTKLMLADNKVYELGFTDFSGLDDILIDLGGDFDVPGYDPELLDVLTATPAEADEKVLGYGGFEPTVAEPKQDNTVTANESPRANYEPPVRLPDGGFAPADRLPSEGRNEHVEAPNELTEGKYIICPHCGEKIWL